MDDIKGQTPLENFTLMLKNENDKMFDELRILKCKVAQLETQQHVPNSGRIIIFGNLCTCVCHLLIDSSIPDFIDKLAQKLVFHGLNFDSLIGWKETQNNNARVIIRFNNNVNMGPFLKILEENQEIPFSWIYYNTCKDISDFFSCQQFIIKNQKNGNGKIKTYKCTNEGKLCIEENDINNFQGFDSF